MFKSEQLAPGGAQLLQLGGFFHVHIPGCINTVQVSAPQLFSISLAQDESKALLRSGFCKALGIAVLYFMVHFSYFSLLGGFFSPRCSSVLVKLEVCGSDH